MAKSKFAAGLKKAGAFWATAKKRVAENEGRGFAEYDDGKYYARLTGAQIGESQSSGRTQVVWTFRFEEGEHEGDEKLDFAGLDSEDNIYYLGRRLEDFGYEMPDSVEELQETLDAIVADKPLCRIRLKTKGEFQNVYVDRVFDKGDEPDLGEDEDDEDKKPAKKGKPAPASKKSKKVEPEATDDEEEDADEESDDEEEADDAASEEAEEEDAEEAEEEASDEEEDAPNDEDEVDLAVGMAVVVTYKGEEARGSVIEILEEEGKARVKLEDNKVIRVQFDGIAVAPDAPEEPKKSKKTAKSEPPVPAPVKKKLKK